MESDDEFLRRMTHFYGVKSTDKVTLTSDDFAALMVLARNNPERENPSPQTPSTPGNIPSGNAENSAVIRRKDHEIERLQADRYHYYMLCTTQAEEIAALRAALQYISNLSPTEPHAMQIKARAALGEKITSVHWSDCAVHREPALPAGECDCGANAPEPEP